MSKSRNSKKESKKESKKSKKESADSHLKTIANMFLGKHPDGKKEILLSVPGYDFNWQHRYRFAKPFRVPAGTKIECVAHFDNSIENPANPDPKKLIGWGDQTWNEMMIGFINYVDASRR